MLLIVEVN